MSFLEKLRSTLIGEQKDYRELVEAGAIIIDVRTKSEFQLGHAKGSRNIPLQTLNTQLNTLRGKVVILVCRSGARAGQAKTLLTRKGIESHNAGAWQNLS